MGAALSYRLLVGRYDRLQQSEALRLLHQEDFRQDLGLLPSAKYQHNQKNGPKGSFATMMGWLRAIDSKRRGEYIEGRHWAREAEKCGLAPRVALEHVKVLAEAVHDRLADARAAVAAMPAGGHPMLDEVEKAIRSRCGSILKTLDR